MDLLADAMRDVIHANRSGSAAHKNDRDRCNAKLGQSAHSLF
jgi:hypothetical protein